MRITKKILKQAKELLEDGNLFPAVRDILKVPRDDFPTFRQKLFEEYGRDDLMPIIQKNRRQQSEQKMTFEKLPEIVKKMNHLSVAQIDEMIGNLQVTIVELNSIKLDM